MTSDNLKRKQEARAEAAEVLRVNLNFSMDNWAKARWFYKDQSFIQNMSAALRKAVLK